MGTSRARYFSKTVGKALEAFDIVRASRQSLSLDELMLRLKLPKVALIRFLHTLESAGYVLRDSTGRYSPSDNHLGAPPDCRRRALIHAALPSMRRLVDMFGETVNLAMSFENHIEVLASIESPQLVRVAIIEGRIVPPHASALGKVILAFQPGERRDVLVRSYGIHRLTAHTIADRRQLENELAAVRTNGYAVDDEECVIGAGCLGAPVRNVDGEVVAAVSLSIPVVRLRDDDNRRRLLEALRRTADEMLRSSGTHEPADLPNESISLGNSSRKRAAIGRRERMHLTLKKEAT